MYRCAMENRHYPEGGRYYFVLQLPHRPPRQITTVLTQKYQAEHDMKTPELM